MKEHQIEISEAANAYIQSQLGNGDYADASDYIESLIREDRLTRDELEKAVSDRSEELEAMAIDGLNSGEPLEADDKYWANKRQTLKDEFGESQ